MIDVWDVLIEILVDLGYKESATKFYLVDLNSFWLFNAETEKYKRIGVISKYDRSYNISYVGYSKIQIAPFFMAQTKEIVDLCDPDCIDIIREVLSYGSRC